MPQLMGEVAASSLRLPAIRYRKVMASREPNGLARLWAISKEKNATPALAHIREKLAVEPVRA